MKKIFPLLLLPIILFVYSCREDESSVPIEEYCPIGDLAELHLLLGNPSNAQTDINMPNNYLLEMDEYAVSYNRDRAIPNWVSWYLSTQWFTGDGNRQDDFRENPFLPSDWYTPDADSYNFSANGFDRGHNCPSADRLCSDNFNSATFFMTNMVPQSPLHNREIWVAWECYFRNLAFDGMELYIVMGNYGTGGDGERGFKTKIVDGDNEITVPASIWKVAIAIPEGDGDDLSFIDGQSMVIAIDIPNSQAVADFDWNDSSFITTVDEIESKTGLDLFSNLPESVQNTLESRTHQTVSSVYPCF